MDRLRIIMYPLQNRFEWQSPDNSSLIVFAIVLGSIILLLVLFNIIRKRLGFGNKKSSTRRYSGFTLSRLARNMGLNREQTKMLDFILKNDGANDPVRSLNSINLLDRHFKRAYHTIERSSITEAELNNRLSVLFSTRNIIETSTGNIVYTNTRQIPENTPAVLSLGKTNYPVKIISAKLDSLVVENPLSGTGSPLHFSEGTKVGLSFFIQSSDGFLIESRVLGSTKTNLGQTLRLSHSGDIKRLSKRSFRRRQSIISTSFYLVFAEGGKKKNQKLTVDKRKYTGNIMNISIGGCSIKTTVPIADGQLLKIEFTRDDKSVVVALGEVLRFTRSGTSTILSIKFVRIPRKSLNSINAFVYEYTD